MNLRSGSRDYLLHTESPNLLVECGRDAAVLFLDPAELIPVIESGIRKAATAFGFEIISLVVGSRARFPKWIRATSEKQGYILHTGTPQLLAKIVRAKPVEIRW